MAEIRWLGHNSIRIRAKEATILIDPVGPVTGYSPSKQTADLVLITHHHDGHANLASVKDPYQIVDGPGEYEMHDVSVIGIRTYHDAKQGKERGKNTMYVIEVEGMRFAHLGDLGHDLTEQQAEALEEVDVLFVPAGGGNVIPPDHAAEIVARVAPKSVIPVQYRTERGDADLATVDAFVKQLGVEAPEPQAKLVLKSSDLADALQLFLLEPEN